MSHTALRRPRRLPGISLKGAKAIYGLIEGGIDSHSYYPEADRKSKLTILRELIWWWIRHGEVNKYYYLYGLDRLGANADSVMPYRHFRALRNSRNLRPDNLSAHYRKSYNFVCVLRDKFLFSQLASSLGFPVPKPWALCSAHSLFWIESATHAPLEHLASNTGLGIDGVCKPVDGIMGASIFLLKVANGRLFIDGAEASIDALRSRLSSRHLLQTRLKQHPALASLHPRSINTLRLVTFNQNGSIVLFSAGLRIGTGGTSKDNWSAGGILVSVDADSGTVRGMGYMKPAFGRRVERHPDTQVVLDGFVVPEFDHAVALAKKFHAHLPGIHSIGWDIAITPEGPVFIEGNDDWDGAVPMVLEPGFRQKLTSMY
jgi:Sugar-transfer associated ATP-grasp